MLAFFAAPSREFELRLDILASARGINNFPTLISRYRVACTFDIQNRFPLYDLLAKERLNILDELEYVAIWVDILRAELAAIL